MRIGRLDERLFRPGTAAAHPDVRGAGRAARRVLGLVRVAPLGVDAADEARLVPGACHDGVAVAADGDREAECVVALGAGALQVRILPPGRPRPAEDVDRAGPVPAVPLIHVDAASGSVLVVAGRHQGVAVVTQAHVVAEQVGRFGVRALDIRLLRPGVPRPREHVDGAGGLGRVVRLVPVDAGGRAVFGGRADGHRVAVAAQREREAELVAVGEQIVLHWRGRPVFDALM